MSSFLLTFSAVLSYLLRTFSREKMLVNSMPSHYDQFGRPSMNQTSGFVYGNAIVAGANIPSLTLNSSKAVLSSEAKAMAACKSHKEAERRRRRRINGHLATLRSLLPNLIKVSFVSFLMETSSNSKLNSSKLPSPLLT